MIHRFTGVYGSCDRISQVSDIPGEDLIMSFGLVDKDTIKTKKALREAIKERGADKILVYDTSGFNNRGTIPITDLRSSDVIVLPDVETDRRFYANFRNGKLV